MISAWTKYLNLAATGAALLIGLVAPILALPTDSLTEHFVSFASFVRFGTILLVLMIMPFFYLWKSKYAMWIYGVLGLASAVTATIFFLSYYSLIQRHGIIISDQNSPAFSRYGGFVLAGTELQPDVEYGDLRKLERALAPYDEIPGWREKFAAARKTDPIYPFSKADLLTEKNGVLEKTWTQASLNSVASTVAFKHLIFTAFATLALVFLLQMVLAVPEELRREEDPKTEPKAKAEKPPEQP